MSPQPHSESKYALSRIEPLQCCESTSATGWSAHDSDHSAADAASSRTALVATAEDQNLDSPRVECITAEPNVRRNAKMTRRSRTSFRMLLTRSRPPKAGNLFKVANYFVKMCAARQGYAPLCMCACQELKGRPLMT